MELTRNELKIMRMLWETNKPLGKDDFEKLSTHADFEPRSLYIAINSLLSKGAIKEDGFYKTSKNYGRYFSAVYPLEEYLSELLVPVEDIIDYKILFSRLLEKT